MFGVDFYIETDAVPTIPVPDNWDRDKGCLYVLFQWIKYLDTK